MIKITKEKQVIKEEVQIEQGIYYFYTDSGTCKIELQEEDGNVFVRRTVLQDYSNVYGIKIWEDHRENGDSLPYEFEKFIFGEKKDEITEEQFEKERQGILKKLF